MGWDGGKFIGAPMEMNSKFCTGWADRKDMYTMRFFKRRFKGARRSHSKSKSDAEKGHLMDATLAVMISKHGWWNGRASRCAEVLTDMRVNRNKLGVVCSLVLRFVRPLKRLMRLMPDRCPQRV